MSGKLNANAEGVLALAGDEARKFNHGYVGTEHLLLGLLLEESCDAAGVLQRLGLSAEKVRGEIEKIVHRGVEAVTVAEIPLTPRAKRVIEFAGEEAAWMNQSQVSPEHLLIGLIRELDGVAGKVMRNLGLEPERVRAEAMKIRLMQVRIVERAVRPVRAGIKHKRKMREELLAHLSEIYQEELGKVNDPMAAMDLAGKRFGDPVELSRDLQRSVPVAARRAYIWEHWLGWRPGETVVQMMLRVSLITFCSMLGLIAIPLIVEMILMRGLTHLDTVGMRTLAAMIIFTPLTQFLIMVCYYKIRDSLFGVFGSRKSVGNVIVRTGLVSLILMVCGAAMIAMEDGSFALVRSFYVEMMAGSILSSLVCPMVAMMHGPVEIRDTIWACMDLKRE